MKAKCPYAFPARSRKAMTAYLLARKLESKRPDLYHATDVAVDFITGTYQEPSTAAERSNQS